VPVAGAEVLGPLPGESPARHSGPPPLVRLPKYRRRRNRLSNSSLDRSL